MFKIINCPELFIEILCFIPEIHEDLLSLILINKQCYEIIEGKNSIFYKLLCKDYLDNEQFTNQKEENNYNDNNTNTTINYWKEQFLDLVLFSWSEHLQTILQQPLQKTDEQPKDKKLLPKKLTSFFQKKKVINNTQRLFKQIQENGYENIIVKCVYNGCLLISKEIESNIHYRNIRSKYPILKDTTLHYYIKHLRKSITHHDSNFLLFGVMNEQICNTIVGKQKDYTYLGEIVLEDKDLFSFNTSYASNGYISSYEKDERKASEFKEAWDVMQVISVEVKGIKEGNIVIKYYLNDKLIYELKDILKGIDVINCKENRLYFGASFYQSVDNFNNTLVIGSIQKLSENKLINQFNKIQKKLKE